MVCHAGPTSVEDTDSSAGVELLSDSTDDIREEYGDVEARKISRARYNDVSNGCVPEREKRRLALAEADLIEYEGLVEVNAVEGDVTVLVTISREF